MPRHVALSQQTTRFVFLHSNCPLDLSSSPLVCVSLSHKMSTPKEKLAKSQALTAKRKKFLRILQSSNYDADYCFTVNEQTRSELENQMKQIIDQHKKQALSATKETEASNAQNAPENRSNKQKRDKLKGARLLKNAHVAYGLNEALKLVSSKGSAMVWLDREVASNLGNVLHKLCATNQTHCFDIDLTRIKSILHLSSLSVMTFRNSVRNDTSSLHGVYQLLMQSIIPNRASDCSSRKELANTHPEMREETPTETPLLAQLELLPANFNYYISKDDHTSNTYRKVMRQRLGSRMEGEGKNEFEMQHSFISISQNEPYFASYSNSDIDYQCRVVTSHTMTKEQSRKSSNKLAEKLFDLDKIDQTLEKGTTLKARFKSPSLIKGQVQVDKSKNKKRNNNNKNSLKNNVKNIKGMKMKS